MKTGINDYRTTERSKWLKYLEVSFKACKVVVAKTSKAIFILRLKTFEPTLVDVAILDRLK